MRVFLFKNFERYQRKQRISDEQLLLSVEEIEQGLIDADLGGRIIKKRVPRRGGGKSGGYRTIIAYAEGERTVFLHGFAKNEKDNISKKELELFQLIGQRYLSASEEHLEALLDDGELFEIEEEE